MSLKLCQAADGEAEQRVHCANDNSNECIDACLHRVETCERLAVRFGSCCFEVVKGEAGI
jgi:hypothetical protein